MQLRNTQKNNIKSSENKELRQVKMDRNNPNEVCDKVYYFDEIKIKLMPQEN